jgi:hypothetical protein
LSYCPDDKQLSDCERVSIEKVQGNDRPLNDEEKQFLEKLEKQYPDLLEDSKN